MSKLNYEHVFNTLVEETAKYITKNNLKAMVLGISGGIDSTVVAAICHEVSKKTGIPLIGRSLPIKNKSDEFDVSKLVGQVFCDDFKVVNLLNMYQHVNQSVYDGEGTLGTPISKGNIQARLRMIYLYNLASIHKGLVMSTDNAAKFVVGDCEGADRMAQDYLLACGVSFRNITVYHMFKAPRYTALRSVPTQGGFTSDIERDKAMTEHSDRDIAFIRKGKESSGTAQNILRRWTK